MTYNKVNLMLPTYKRVERLAHFVRMAQNLCMNLTNICFSFCVNKKDLETQEWIKKHMEEHEYDLILETTRQPNLSKYFNMLYDQTRFNDPGTLVSMVGDDMEFCTAGWDVKILEAVNEKDGNVLVYLNDDFVAKEKLCVNLFTTRKVVEATGVPFMCPKYHADMIDTVWMFVASQVNILKYLPDVVLKHNHDSGVPEHLTDETFQRLRPIRAMYAQNQAEEVQYIARYSVQAAANLIEKGIGTWSPLNVA